MRRAGVLAAVLTALMAVVAGCRPSPAFVAEGRRVSWHRVRSPAFTAGLSSSIDGLVSPGDGYGAWTAVGSVRDAQTTAVAWTSGHGTRWVRSDLDHGDAREAEASAGARRQGMVVVVGTVVTPGGDRDGRIWSSKDAAAWSIVPVPAGGPGDQRLTSVAGGPMGFVAAGKDGSVPAVWFSADGGSWARVRGPILETEAIEGVAVGPQGAMGRAGPGSRPGS